MNARANVPLPQLSCATAARRWVITTAEGHPLASQLTLDEAHSLICEHQSDPPKYPDWQGDLVVKAIPGGDRRRAPARTTCRGYADGLGLPITPGAAPAMAFTGSTVGLDMSGAGNETINVACGSWTAMIDIELALYHLDDFASPDRANLVRILSFHYGVQLLRGAA